MKATEAGKIIGYAMQAEEFKDANTAEILVFVNLGYYLPKGTTEKLERLEALEKRVQGIEKRLASK
jgi:ABC-type uncharacterized transport system fused permease/ATPase subunit